MKSTLSTTQKARSKPALKSKTGLSKPPARLKPADFEAAKRTSPVADKSTGVQAAKEASRVSPKKVRKAPKVKRTNPSATSVGEDFILGTSQWVRLLLQCTGLLLFLVLWIQSASKELKRLFDPQGHWHLPAQLGEASHLLMPLALVICYGLSYGLVRLLARRRLNLSEHTVFCALSALSFSILWAI